VQLAADLDEAVTAFMVKRQARVSGRLISENLPNDIIDSMEA
jgi:hypothetical protein